MWVESLSSAYRPYDPPLEVPKRELNSPETTPSQDSNLTYTGAQPTAALSAQRCVQRQRAIFPSHMRKPGLSQLARPRRQGCYFGSVFPIWIRELARNPLFTYRLGLSAEFRCAVIKQVGIEKEPPGRQDVVKSAVEAALLVLFEMV